MKRKTVSELICPWLQVHYPTLGTRQADLYARVSHVNVYVQSFGYVLAPMV